MFTLHVDRARLLIEMRLNGFFPRDEAIAATEALRLAVRSLGASVGRHLTLYDATGISVAPPETIEYLQSAWSDPAIRPLWARRVAYCTPSALARLQIVRMRTSRADLGVFAARAEAMAWLLDPNAAPDTQAA